jgi:uncharacterized protein (TIGR02757 family)
MYKNENDIEIMGFISSVFAYGNVVQINNSLKRILVLMKNKPYHFIKNFPSSKKSQSSFQIKHRFYSEDDVHSLFLLLKSAIEESGSLKNLFLNGFSLDDVNVKNSISKFSNHFLNLYCSHSGKITHGVKFMFPQPEKGSACKRMNLFLRWMVRKDELDFGIWDEIPKDKLVIPVDTHIAKISRSLKLTSIKNVSWKMAEEITQNLKQFDAADPVKYDFALCHIGMRKIKF